MTTTEPATIVLKAGGFALTNLIHHGFDLTNTDYYSHVGSTLLYEYFTKDMIKGFLNTDSIPIVGDMLGGMITSGLNPAVQGLQTYAIRMLIGGDMRLWVIVLDTYVVDELIGPLLTPFVLGDQVSSLVNPLFAGSQKKSLTEKAIEEDKRRAYQKEVNTNDFAHKGFSVFFNK